MGNFCRLIGVFIMLFILEVRLAAQQLTSDQVIAKASADHLLLLRDHAAIFNGAEYVGYRLRDRGRDRSG